MPVPNDRLGGIRTAKFDEAPLVLFEFDCDPAGDIKSVRHDSGALVYYELDGGGIAWNSLVSSWLFFGTAFVQFTLNQDRGGAEGGLV